MNDETKTAIEQLAHVCPMANGRGIQFSQQDRRAVFGLLVAIFIACFAVPTINYFLLRDTITAVNVNQEVLIETQKDIHEIGEQTMKNADLLEQRTEILERYQDTEQVVQQLEVEVDALSETLSKSGYYED